MFRWKIFISDDLAVLTTMAPERLCLGCGLRTDDPHSPLTIGDRPSLFRATSWLLNFVLLGVNAQTDGDAEFTPRKACGLLHFVAYPGSLEGKTDYPGCCGHGGGTLGNGPHPQDYGCH